jgi:hypothetical protein
MRRILLPRTRKTAEPPPAPVVPPDAIVQRDDGRYQLGLADDAPGGFPTRQFAQAVAARQTGAAA